VDDEDADEEDGDAGAEGLGGGSACLKHVYLPRQIKL
jgi:hypothetical protein